MTRRARQMTLSQELHMPAVALKLSQLDPDRKLNRADLRRAQHAARAYLGAAGRRPPSHTHNRAARREGVWVMDGASKVMVRLRHGKYEVMKP